MRYLVDLSELQLLQYINAETIFNELRRVRRAATQTHGSMFWREVSGHRYLIRTSRAGAQTSLGRESVESKVIYADFVERKATVADRLAVIQARFNEQRRMNLALRIGRAPAVVVKVLNALARANLTDRFTVVGTQALHAYESAAGVRLNFGAADAVEIDLRSAASQGLTLLAQAKHSREAMLRALQRADPSFERLENRRETFCNQRSFEVKVIRCASQRCDPSPARMSQMVVATNGEMAIMHTLMPLDFVAAKRALASDACREPLVRQKDAFQADLIEQLVHSHLPQYLHDPKASAKTNSTLNTSPPEPSASEIT